VQHLALHECIFEELLDSSPYPYLSVFIKILSYFSGLRTLSLFRGVGNVFWGTEEIDRAPSEKLRCKILQEMTKVVMGSGSKSRTEYTGLFSNLERVQADLEMSTKFVPGLKTDLKLQYIDLFLDM
jgi:hypothetical protein